MKKKQLVSKEVQIFRESIRKVVVMLSGKNIPVAERGDRAYVEYKADGTPTLVCIPSLPDDASDSLMSAIRGFIDHEVAHLLFTDSKSAFSLLSKKDSPAFQLWNAVEDTFIERRMAEVFSGSKRNLIKTQQHVITKVFVHKTDDAIRALSRNPRELFLRFFLVPVLRAWAGQNTFSDYMEPYWPVIAEPVSKLHKAGIPDDVLLLTSTEDCIRLAARISLVLRDDMEKVESSEKAGRSNDKNEKQETSEKIGSKQPNTNESESNDNDYNSEEDEPENDEPGSLNNTKDKDIKDTEAGSDSSTSDEPEPGQEEDNSQAENDAQPGESSPGDDEATSRSESENDANEDDKHEANPDPSDGHGLTEGDIPLDEALKALEEAEIAPEESMEDALNTAMKKELEEVSPGSYRPYQRTYDYIGPIEGAETFLRKSMKTFGKLHMYAGITRWAIDDAGVGLFARNIEHRLSDGNTATLAKQLERAIASKNKVQFIPGQRRGKVHSANLYRLSMNDDRVFRRREDHKAVNACVQQVIDLSGSMNGDRICLALASAYAIADALDRIKVPNIITGFTTAGLDDAAYRKYERDYSRYEGLMLPTIKDWHERTNTPITRQRIGCLSGKFPLLNNIDGESVLALAQHFAARTEDRKIMIVLSDGLPAGVGFSLNSHLREVARALESSDQIELLGVGIQTDAPSQFYKHSVKVDNVEALGETVVKKLSGLLLG